MRKALQQHVLMLAAQTPGPPTQIAALIGIPPLILNTLARFSMMHLINEDLLYTEGCMRTIAMRDRGPTRVPSARMHSSYIRARVPSRLKYGDHTMHREPLHMPAWRSRFHTVPHVPMILSVPSIISCICQLYQRSPVVTVTFPASPPEFLVRGDPVQTIPPDNLY